MAKKNNEKVEDLNEQKVAQEEVNATTEEETTDGQSEKEATATEEVSAEDKLMAENAELKDKFRRLFAEFDNYKKRTSKERIELFKTAGLDIIKELLPVIDDFERAIKANEEATGKPAEENDGFVLIHKKLFANLERKGLQKMEAKGDDFNADFHEAIARIPAGEEQKGKVIDVVEEGYLLNEKIIRHAKVVVGN